MSAPETDEERTRRRQRVKGLSAFGATFGISIASIFGGELLQFSEAERNRAPALDLAVVESGEPVRLEQKNPTVVRFVEPGCRTCSDDLPVLDRSRRRWDGKVNYVIVASGAPDSADDPFEGVHESIQVAADPNRRTAKAYGADELPATVFITADGQILERDTGPLDGDDLERRIRSVIAEGPGS